MDSRILLIRHGPSAHPRHGRWLTASQFHDWRMGYDAASVAADGAPPASLVADVGTANVIVSSDTPRAIASAERLAPNRAIYHSADMREAELPIPAVPVVLPILGWEALIHLTWLYRITRGTDTTPELRRRVELASRWLNQLAQTSSSVAVITHGVFRRLVAAELLRTGWRATTWRHSYRPWSAWSLRSSIPQ